MAREVGFKNISLDIMFSLPNQTLEMLKIDLENVEYMSSAFADECVGIIVKIFDLNTLQQRIRLINGKQKVLNTLGNAILERVKMQMIGF